MVFLCLLLETVSSRENAQIATKTYRRTECSRGESSLTMDGRITSEVLSNESCNTSPWQYCNNGTCTCGHTPHDALQCEIGKNLTVLSCYCATVNQSNFLNELGSCFYNCGNFDKSNPSNIQYITLPNTTDYLDEFMCGKHFNRTGTLCGRCIKNYYPPAYSFDMNCVECPNGKSNWWKFMLAAFLPLTVFYFVVLFFQINITSSSLHSFVFYCQGLAISPMARLALLNTINKSFIEDTVRFFGSLIWHLES